MILHLSQIHLRHAIEELNQLFVAFGHCRAQFVAVHIIVVKQTCKAALRLAALGGFLNMAENCLQGFVQVFILGCVIPDIAEQLAGQDEKALFFHQSGPRFFSLAVRHIGIMEIRIPRIPFAPVDVILQIFRYITVEHRAKNIILKVPAVHRTSQFISNRPDCPVELIAFLFLLHVSHDYSSICAVSPYLTIIIHEFCNFRNINFPDYQLLRCQPVLLSS